MPPEIPPENLQAMVDKPGQGQVLWLKYGKINRQAQDIYFKMEGGSYEINEDVMSPNRRMPSVGSFSGKSQSGWVER